MSGDLAARAFQVVGVVQGVGFRWFAREVAQRLGVTGWVENRADGSVHGEVHGTQDAVMKFLAEVGRGPTLGRVEKIEVTEIGARTLSGFAIRK